MMSNRIFFFPDRHYASNLYYGVKYSFFSPQTGSKKHMKMLGVRKISFKNENQPVAISDRTLKMIQKKTAREQILRRFFAR